MNCCDETFVLNNAARVDIEIRTLAGVLTDPDELRFEYQPPDEDTPTELIYGTDAELVRDSAGRYHVVLANDVAGWWKWYWESDGIEAADQGRYRVVEKIL